MFRYSVRLFSDSFQKMTAKIVRVPEKPKKIDYFTIGGLLIVTYLLSKSKFDKNSLFPSLNEQNFLITPDKTVSNFEEVRGISEVKAELEELVDMIKNKEKYIKLGARLPRGILLTGEPGTGKTLLARAVAGEANATFFSASGSEFDEIYVGVGASRIRELFKQAKIFSPSIIFIDEIDTIGCSRIEENYGSRTQDTLNQLLVEMDGFEEHQNVIVIAATNMAGDMDPALLRPGRFDKEIAVPVPNKADREDILNYYLKKAFYDKSIQIDKVASATTGFTGADLSNMVNTALLLAVNSGRDACNEEDLMNARDRITLGIASPGVFRSERKKMKIALREAAHALALIEFDNMNRLDKISIIKRGQRQGKTSALPVKDHVSINRKQLFNQAKIQLATAAAEILFFGKMKVTDYNRESIHRACNILRQSFMEGIDEDFGLMFYKKFSEMSKIKQNLLEEVVKKEIDVLYNDVSLFLRDKKEIIIKLASELVKKETLTHKEVIEILNNVSNE